MSATRFVHKKLSADFLGEIAGLIGGPAAGHAGSSIVAHLDRLGVQTAILEQPYIDRDFSADHRAFYAGAFKAIERWCKRVHFFATDLEAVDQEQDWKKKSECLKSAEGAYLGFVVVRPLAHAPLGRTVLRPPTGVEGHQLQASVHARFDVHLLGARLSIEGVPFAQQDTHSGACAQIAIWVCGRHLHQAFRHPWYSVADITRFGLSVTDLIVARALPSGSRGISHDGMIRAIRAMGYQPLVSTSMSLADPKKWASPPVELVTRYIDSGLPVILGVVLSDGAHAVAAIGLVSRPITTAPPPQPYQGSTTAIFTAAFVVHDDQRGCYLNLPIDSQDAGNANLPAQPEQRVTKPDGSSEIKKLDVQSNVNFMIVPLPDKVVIKAETAELLALSVVNGFVRSWPAIKVHYKPTSLSIAEQLISLVTDGKFLRRTYLSSGAGYKQHLIQGAAHNDVKGIIASVNLPPYVYVTEIGSFEDLNKPSNSDQQVLGHVIVDATSNHQQGVLICHVPGLVIIRDVNRAIGGRDYDEELYVIEGDQPYRPRRRGIASI